MASFPTKLQQELLVFGYIRSFESKTLRIPKCIKEVCLKRYDEYMFIEVAENYNLPGAPTITGGLTCIKGIVFEAEYIRWRHSAGVVINVSSLPSYIQPHRCIWYFHAYCPQLHLFKHKRWCGISRGQLHLHWYPLAAIHGDLEIICQFRVKEFPGDGSPAKHMTNITKIEWDMTKLAKCTSPDVELLNTKMIPTPEAILHGPASKDGHWFVSYTPPDIPYSEGEGLITIHLLEMPVLLQSITANVRFEAFYGGTKKIDCAKRCTLRREGVMEVSARIPWPLDKPTRIAVSSMIFNIRSGVGSISWRNWSKYGVIEKSANL